MSEPLRPVSDVRSSLSDLVEVLLNKGVLLNVDLLISVADIPLIGVSVKAAVAGIETMLEYGMMRDWDAQTRAWVQRSISRDVAFEPGEELLLRMPGEYEEPEPFRTWHPGTLYLTDRRLFLFRRDLRKVLWSEARHEIEGAAIEHETAMTGEPLPRIRLALAHRPSVRLIASRPERLVEILGAATPERVPAPILEGKLWYLEPRAGGAVWRGGEGRIVHGQFTWKSPLDARPAVSFRLIDLVAASLVEARSPSGPRALQIRTAGGDLALLAASDVGRWLEALHFESGILRDGTDG